MTGFFQDKLFVNRLVPNNKHVREPMCTWDTASSLNLNLFRCALDYRLCATDFTIGLFQCSNNKWQSIEHNQTIGNVHS